MNDFETRLMVQSQKVDSKPFRIASWLNNFDEEQKSKRATEKVQILDLFLLNEFLYTGIESPR